MKTLNFNTIFATLAILFTASFANAQTPPHCATVIEITDGNYKDKLWMVTEPGTTDGFDNGWDGYKFLSSASYIPQIYDNTVDGKFQVSSFPTIDNNSFDFLPGTATLYKMTFTHYDINYFYKALYLVDLVKGDTVNIYKNLSTYKFSATKADLVERFKFITDLTPKPVTTNGDTVTAPGNTGVTTGNAKEIETDLNKANNVKVKAFNSIIQIENPNTAQATVRVIEALSGKQVKQITVNAGETATINTNVSTGLFVITTAVEADTATKTVLLH